MGKFTQLKLGGGGWVTGADVAPTGAWLGRTDTNGVYWRSGASDTWHQIVTRNSMPSGDSDYAAGHDIGGNGAWDAVFAPSNPSRVYMRYTGAMYRSDNVSATGTTWTELTNFLDVGKSSYQNSGTNGANGPNRISGQKIAVDPVNADHVISAGPAGVYRSTDAGASWTATSITAPTASPYACGICFDQTSATTGSPARTSIIYAPSTGNGVWKSADGGVTWSKLTAGTGPTTVRHAQVGATGIYFCADGNASGAWKNNGTTWTQLTGASSSNANIVAAHPTTAGRIAIIVGGGEGNANNVYVSSDDGATFAGGGIIDNGLTPRNATDIPWLGWTNEGYMSTGDARWDPVTGLFNVSQGIGWWTTTLPTTNTTFTWTSQSLGLDQLVPQVIISPPGGAPVFGVSDRGIFQGLNLSTYPSTHGPNRNNSLLDCRALDFVESSPAKIVALANTQEAEESGYSLDGGVTWNKFNVYPRIPGFRSTGDQSFQYFGGCIAVNSNNIDNVLWAESQRGFLWQTTNATATTPVWTKITPSGVNTTGGEVNVDPGWGSGYFNNRKILAADRVTANVFYAYNTNVSNIGGSSSSGGTRKFFKSTDSGATWTAQWTGSGVNVAIDGSSGGQDVFAAQIYAVPGNVGHLFYTSGFSGSYGTAQPQSLPFMHTTDGGVTWTAPITGGHTMYEVIAYGFGKSRTVGGYPAIYAYGYYDGIQGIYLSEDAGATWTLLIGPNVMPDTTMQSISCIWGDMNTFGLFYAGMSTGGGFIQADFTTTGAAVGFSVIHGHGRRHTKMIGY